MTNREFLLAIATGAGSVMEKTRELIGEDTLAMLLAKAALSGTSEQLSPTAVAEVLGCSRTTASDKIDRAAVKESISKS